MIFAIDFDGTCVSHAFPEIGKDIGAVPVLKKIIDAGHKIILYTMRDNKLGGRQFLSEAIQWFADNQIPLWGINENPDQKSWTQSPKPFAHYYIDDMAIGCPLVWSEGERPYVDWVVINEVINRLSPNNKQYIDKSYGLQ